MYFVDACSNGQVFMVLVLSKYQDLGDLHSITNLLRVFVVGNCELIFYTFIRPNQEQLQKMQLSALWQESNLRPCDSGAALQPSIALNLRLALDSWPLWLGTRSTFFATP